MELKEFNQAKARKTSVNRITIRCRRAASTTLLCRAGIADEKFLHVFHSSFLCDLDNALRGLQCT
jgi:hypothetical protein